MVNMAIFRPINDRHEDSDGSAVVGKLHHRNRYVRLRTGHETPRSEQQQTPALVERGYGQRVPPFAGNRNHNGNSHVCGTVWQHYPSRFGQPALWQSCVQYQIHGTDTGMLRAYVGIANPEGLVCLLPDTEEWVRSIAGEWASFSAVLSEVVAEEIWRDMTRGDGFRALQLLDEMANEIHPIRAA